MKKIKVTTRTGAEIDAIFDSFFRNRKPASAKPVTQADRLEPYRKAIMKQRRRGFTWKEIADAMTDPKIGEPVTEKLLKKVFGAAESTAKTPLQAPAERLVLDPATGQPVTPAPVPPAPMTPKEHQQFDPLLQGLIPVIVKMKQNRKDAHSYANNAVERFRPNEVARFHELLDVELDTLTEANCSRYGVAPELIPAWRRRWA